jgi:uncharacterized protein (DUF697 family)
MSRKKLPKAITQSIGDLSEASARGDEHHKTHRPRHRGSEKSSESGQSSPPPDTAKATPAALRSASKPTSRGQLAARQSTHPPHAAKAAQATRRRTSKSSSHEAQAAAAKPASPPETAKLESAASSSAPETLLHGEAATQPASPPDTAKTNSAPETPSRPMEGELLPPALSTHAEEPHAPPSRRAVAEKIVDRYKLYAAMGGLSPIPIMTAAGLTVVVLQMVKTLSTLYEVPFERNLTRSIVVGLMGGAVPTGLGVATASALALAVPGIGFVGVAVSAFTASALTGRIGHVFIDRFESGTMPPTADESSA